MTTDITPEAVERLAEDMQKHMPLGRGANTLRALTTALTEARAEIVRLRDYVNAFDDLNHQKNEHGANEYYGALLVAHINARATLASLDNPARK